MISILTYNDLIVSVCCENLAQKQIVYEIEDFKFKKLELKESIMTHHKKPRRESDFFEESLPKIELQKSIPQVYQEIKDELMLDGNSKQNFSYIFIKQVDDYIHRLMNDCIDKYD